MSKAPITPAIAAGDFLHASWGYEQTNATFFYVTKRTPAQVVMVEVGGEQVRSKDGYDIVGVIPTVSPVRVHDNDLCAFSDDDHPRRYETPVAPCWVPKELRRKVQHAGTVHESVKVNSYMWAHKVDENTPQRDTMAQGGMGH